MVQNGKPVIPIPQTPMVRNGKPIWSEREKDLGIIGGLTSNRKLAKKYCSKTSDISNDNHDNHKHKPIKIKRNIFQRLSTTAKDSNVFPTNAVTSSRRSRGKSNDLPSSPSLLEDEPDPLTCLIEAHNTQKVRFNLSRNMVSDQPTISRAAFNSPSTRNDHVKNILASSTSSNFGASTSSNIKTFMKRVLQKKNSEDTEDECIFSKSLANSTQGSSSSSSESFGLKESSSFSSLRSQFNDNDNINNSKPCSPTKQNFRESQSTTNLIRSHIHKGEKAQFSTFHYPSAGKHYLAAMQALDTHSYPDTHSLRLKTLKLLNDVQHSRRSLEHSCQIVKMGLQHEEKTQYIKALKMYTIAYRIRRDALGKRHPSLPVLLNMLGSLQVKRGELDEAMQLFKLALHGKLENGPGDVKVVLGGPSVAPWTRSVTLMEMGVIFEKQGDMMMALKMYHDSLGCVMKINSDASDIMGVGKGSYTRHDRIKATVGEIQLSPSHLGSQEIRLVRSTSLPLYGTIPDQNEEMEAYLEGGETDSNAQDFTDPEADPCGFYDSIFHKDRPMESKNVNINVAMTLYYIGNLRRRSRNFEAALCAYQSAYRGMSLLLGAKHTNVAAILGNIGNCHKEMKGYDEAYNIYQKVLRIESLHFGLGHPEVIVTMHNIAMIEKCRGNYKEAISLYREVLTLQRSRLGPTHESVTVTSSCLADVYEISGDYKSAIAAYKETISIRCQALNSKIHPDLGVLYHSCAMAHAKNHDLENAASYLRKALRLYEYNKITNDPYLNAQRDAADIQAKLALLPGKVNVTSHMRSF